MSSPFLQRFTNVTLAACACALGGQLIRQAEEDDRLVFYVALPDGLDLSDPGLRVPIPSLVAWVDALAGKVRAFHRRQRGGAR